MARKKTMEPAVKAAEAAEAEAIEIKTEDIKAEETVAESQTEKAEAKPKKAPAKRKTTKAVKTEAVKEEPAKEALTAEPEKAAAPKKERRKASSSKTAKAAVQKNVLHIQYAGKSIAEEDLIKSAKDIWKHDLKRKVSELTSIELYVKTEESKVYYVMNGDVTGSFDI